LRDGGEGGIEVGGEGVIAVECGESGVLLHLLSLTGREEGAISIKRGFAGKSCLSVNCSGREDWQRGSAVETGPSVSDGGEYRPRHGRSSTKIRENRNFLSR